MVAVRPLSKKVLVNFLEEICLLIRAQASSTTRSHSGQFHCKQAMSNRPVQRKFVSCSQRTFRTNRCYSNQNKGCTWICRRRRRCSVQTCLMLRTSADPFRPARQAMPYLTATRVVWSWSEETQTQLSSIRALLRWISRCLIRKKTRWVVEKVARATKWHILSWTNRNKSHQSWVVSLMSTCLAGVVKEAQGKCWSWRSISSQRQRFHR